MNNLCKILVTYKEKHDLIESDILLPIQTGRDVAEEQFVNMIGDNTGDNISAKNNEYSELSALFWAWKNYEQIGNPDFIGHMQYRRHFILNDEYENQMETPLYQQFGYSVKFVNSMDDNYIEAIGLDKTTIHNTLSKYDMVVVKKANMHYLKCNNAKEDFLKNVPCARYTDYYSLLNMVKKIFPEYKKQIDTLEQGPYRYFYHMFIMKKETFYEYMNFMFSVLFELEKEIDFTDRGTRGKRVMGYLGEFLLSLFVWKKYEENLRIKEVYASCILNNQDKTLDKIKNKNVFAFFINNNAILENVIVSINSICRNIDTLENTDFVIFHQGISEYNLTRLKFKLNLGIKYNTYNIEQDSDTPFVYKKSIIIQLLYILRNCKTVTVVNPYCIFNKTFSLTSLFKNTVNAFLYTNVYKEIISKSNYESYYKTILKLKDPYKYFTSVIFHARANALDFAKINELLTELTPQISTEDEILNYIFKDDISILSAEKIFFSNAITRLKYFSSEEFLKDADNATVVYIDNERTIENQLCKHIFNKYADLDTIFSHRENDIKIISYITFINNIKDVLIYKKNCFNYWRCRLLQNLTIGKMREHYSSKKRILKNKIIKAKKCIK